MVWVFKKHIFYKGQQSTIPTKLDLFPMPKEFESDELELLLMGLPVKFEPKI